MQRRKGKWFWTQAGQESKGISQENYKATDTEAKRRTKRDKRDHTDNQTNRAEEAANKETWKKCTTKKV